MGMGFRYSEAFKLQVIRERRGNSKALGQQGGQWGQRLLYGVKVAEVVREELSA